MLLPIFPDVFFFFFHFCLIFCWHAQASPPADNLSLGEGAEGAGFAKTPSPGAEASAAGAHFNREKMCWEVREEGRGEVRRRRGNFGWMREAKRRAYVLRRTCYLLEGCVDLCPAATKWLKCSAVLDL